MHLEVVEPVLLLVARLERMYVLSQPAESCARNVLWHEHQQKVKPDTVT